MIAPHLRLAGLGRLAALLLLSTCFAALIPAARAQSVWGGSLTWTQTGAKAINAEISRTIRRSLYPTASVGTTLSNNCTLDFGDGATSPVDLVVISVDDLRDKLVASATFAHTYAFTGSASFTLSTSASSRPAPLPADGSSGIAMRLSAVVNISDTGAYRSSPRAYPPGHILYAPTGAPLSFTIPASDPNGDSFTFRFATTAECSLPNPIPTGATLDGTTGVLTLPSQPVAIRLCTQVILDDGQGTSSLDLVFSFTPYSSPPPAFTTLPSGGTVVGYVGFNADFQIVASDSGNLQTDILLGALPPGLTLLSSVPSGTNSSTRTLNMRWSPVSGSSGTTPVNFAAINSLGAAALTTLRFQVGVPDILYVSGIIRDFINPHPDFNLGPSADSATRFVQAQLGSDGKPAFLPVAGITSTSMTTFPQWWNTLSPINAPTVYSISLSNAFQTDSRVHNFFSSAFYPIGDHSNFTYEVHTYMSFLPGASLTFKSSGDLWVFIDGRLVVDLGGIHGLETATIALDGLVDVGGQPLPPPATGTVTRQVDLFYAHRSSQHVPQLGIQLLPAVTCESIDTAVPVDPRTFVTQNATRLPDGTLQLIGPNFIGSASTAAWLDAPRLPASQGFKLSFDFEMSAGLPGFALVFSDPANDVYARGAASAELGYGGIPGCVAIEFDTERDAALNDPAFTSYPDHISVHTRYPQANSANELYSAGAGSLETLAGSLRHLNDSAVHRIAVEVRPDTAISPGRVFWIRVWMDPDANPGNVVPVVQAPLSLAQMAVMTGDPTGQTFKRLLFGFTASTGPAGSGASGKIKIRNLTLTTAEPAAEYTKLVSTVPATVTAGEPQTVVVALASHCNNLMTAPGYASSFAATLIRNGSGETTPVGITDLGEGSYVLDFRPLLLGDWSLAVSFKGVPVYGTPKTFTVISPYAAWAATAFPSGTPADQRDPAADPDRDGTVNGLEFVTGGNPLVAESLFTTECSATELVLCYPRKRSVPTGADLPQVSEDLVGWLPATGLQREVLPLDGTRDQIRLHLPLGPEARRFLRVVFDEGAF